jgi:hypothetical protein
VVNTDHPFFSPKHLINRKNTHMPYQIRADQNGETLFRTFHHSAWNVEALIHLFIEMDERFPDADGFRLTIERFPLFPTTIDRKTFRENLQSGNPVDILKLFVDDEGFREFQAEKIRLTLEEAEGIDDAQSYFPIAEAVLVYHEGYYLIEQNREQQHRFLLPGYRPIDSDNYLLLEYELYLSYLQEGDC